MGRCFERGIQRKEESKEIVKTIKKGRKQKGWAKKHKCTGDGNDEAGCGAKLLIEQDDLFETSQSCMGKEIDYFVTFKCQECGQLTDIDNAPSNIDLPTYEKWKKNNA